MKKIDGRKTRKRSPVVRKLPVPHRSVLKRRRAKGKKTWAGAKNRAAQLAGAVKRSDGRMSRAGVPDGMTREQAKQAWAEARAKAEEIFQAMVDKGIAQPLNLEDFEKRVIKNVQGENVEVLIPKSDEAKGTLALKEAVVDMLSPMSDRQARQTAIRTVLEWTKAKPASKVEASIQKPEDWLAMVAADASKDDKAD